MADFGKHLAGKLDRAANQIRTELPRALMRAGLVVAGQAQRNVSGGGSSSTMLNVRTGRLRSSISAVMVGHHAVKVGTNVVYAHIHEEGGMIFATKTLPGSTTGRRWMRFKTPDGQWHTVDRVRIPARPYLGPALEKKRDQVIAIIRKVYSGSLFIGGTES